MSGFEKRQLFEIHLNIPFYNIDSFSQSSPEVQACPAGDNRLGSTILLS